jgi:hypothetical protein
MKLKTGYSDLTPAEGLELSTQVKANMTAKPIWAALAALLTQLGLDITALTTAMAATGTGPGATQQLAAADDALSHTLGAIADGANRTAGVTDAELASTGLPAVKQRTQLTEPPPAPQNLRMRHAPNPGGADGTCDPIPGGNIRCYEGQKTLDPAYGPWSEIFTFPNSRSLNFRNCERGKDTWFRVRARNTIGPGPWSDPARSW